MKHENGFTVVELLVAIVFLVFVGGIFYLQKQELEISRQDSTRKTALNAIYYNLEEVYFPASKSYPRKISSENLRAMDPTLLKDPSGKSVGDPASDYRYEPGGCEGEACKSYQLRADLEREDDFILMSRN